MSFRILFVCHGNICRSPMAEFVFKELIRREGLSDRFYVESAATSSEEIGNPVYPPVRRILASKGISCKNKVARRINSSDYDKFDLIIGMDSANIRSLNQLFDDKDNKIKLFLSYAGIKRDIADPWYSDDFDSCYKDILLSSRALLSALT